MRNTNNYYISSKTFFIFIFGCTQFFAEAGITKRSYESRIQLQNSLTPHHTKTIPDHTTCCLIPYCDGPSCFDSFSCGYICSQGKYQMANPEDYGTTPGYRLKPSYHKYECRFDGDCKLYEFKCDHCPDPDTPYFHISFVANNCIKCYY